MSTYEYPPLSIELQSFRLLCLLPAENESTKTTRIRCRLAEYSLQDSGKSIPLYDALSYTWDGPAKPRSIFINEQKLAVTENLYAALLQIRDRGLNQIIWIDALCINQADTEERGQQVQLMAQIYSKATRVLVWLGETTDNSHRALESIRIAAKDGSRYTWNDKISIQAVQKLLQRSWFHRIWVLQEVAAARSIQIMCGSSVIDGYAFCLGLKTFHMASPDLEGSIHSITDLIRGSIFRETRIANGLDRFSLDIRPLGELIDMFHTYEATESVDKVYALLGMSSDDPISRGLVPNYGLLWENLFEDLVKFLLSKQVYVKAWTDGATIKSKGCILGQVWSVEIDNRIGVELRFKGMPSGLWPYQSSAKKIRKGDIICLLQGAPQPLLIRPRKDYFSIIRIVAYTERKLTGSIEWPNLITPKPAFPHSLTLIWDWKSSSEALHDPEDYESLLRTNNCTLEKKSTDIERRVERVMSIWNIKLVFDDTGEIENAREKLRESRECYDILFRKGSPRDRRWQHDGTPLLWAVEDGYITVVDKLLVNHRIDPNSKDRAGRAALSYAAENGHAAIVQQLLATRKVESDSRDKYGRTPLSYAAGNGHAAIVQQLLATPKVESDSRCCINRTPLSYAAENGHTAVVQHLLATGNVEVKSKDEFRRTPLSYAVEKGYTAVAQQLANAPREGKGIFGWVRKS